MRKFDLFSGTAACSLLAAVSNMTTIDDGADDTGGGGGAGDAKTGDDKSGDGVDVSKIKDFGDDDNGDKSGDKKSDDKSGDDDKSGTKRKGPNLDDLADGDKKSDDDDGDKKSEFDYDNVPKALRGKDAQETIDKLSKAYKGQRNKGTAPENVDDYTLDLPEVVASAMASDDPENKQVFDILKTLAKDNGLSTEQYSNVIGGLLGQLQEANFIETPIDPKEHFALLGGEVEGRKIAQVVKNWGEGMLRKEILTAEEHEEFKIMAGTAYGVRIMSKMREMTGKQTIPVNFGDVDGKVTKAELQARVADERYKTDPAFQQETDRMYAEKYPSQK